MRKAQKAQVEDFIALLKEAQNEIIKALKNDDVSQFFLASPVHFCNSHLFLTFSPLFF